MNTKYLFFDPPASPFLPENIDIVVKSGGCDIYGSILLAGGAAGEKHPCALMLHGFPGHEKNLDLAQALRRTGMNVAFFSYRGAWGSYGDYAVSHLKEDANAVLLHLYKNADQYRIERESIWLVGHSLGGFTALHTLAEAAVALKGAVLIAPCDLGMMYLEKNDKFIELVEPEDREGGCLRVARKGYLQNEADKNAGKWRFSSLAEGLSGYPLLFIGGTRDEVTPPKEHIEPLLNGLSGDVSYRELNDGHGFAGSRVALAQTAAEWLAARN